MDNANLIYHVTMKKRKVVVGVFMYILWAVMTVLLRYLYRNSRPRLPPRPYSMGSDSQSVPEVLTESENENIPYPGEDETVSNHEASTQNAPAYNGSDSQESSSTNSYVGKKRKRRNDDDTIDKLVSVMHDLRILLAKYMTAPMIVIDGVQEKLLLLDGALRSLDGITDDEIYKACHMFVKDRDLVLVFFGVEPKYRLKWLRTMLPEMVG